MSLAAGARLGNYEILAPLGAGGMGEVYRARDTRLGRTVAIKALTRTFAGDPERIARFEREARILASLHHANIATIYGIEDADQSSFLVLEFIDGETLAHRLTRGALPVSETLEIGSQVAAAIDAAHEQGVVHRDLKPGNVMLTSAGMVKVLDFGLAKNGTDMVGLGGPSGSDLSASPTAVLSPTAAGVILGTAPYMSPEQARGKPVDRRADVWALGCVLYECLCGRPAFAGETPSDVIARILERDPEFEALPAHTPGRLRDLVRRCLTKDPDQRPRDVGDLRRELRAIALEMSSPAAPSRPGDTTPSVAVLYFENLSQDAGNDYFCAGITEDILTDLTKIRGLRVASRNAVARFRGAPADVERVARDLNVRAVLEGSIRRAGDRVRITAQLVSADGFQLWAERFDRTMQDVFAVQEEIASAIAGALKVALTPAEAAQIADTRPADARAYDLYLKGRAEYDRRSAESLRNAMKLFEQAIEVDPRYALAYAGVADVYGQFLQWDLAGDRKAAIDQGLAAAQRAIELNPKLAEAYKAKSLVLRATSDEAMVEATLREALKADPRHVPSLSNLGVSRFSAANLAEAERLFRRCLAIQPDQVHTILWLSFVADMTNRPADSDREGMRLLSLAQDPFYVSALHSGRMWGFARSDQPDRMESALADARAAGMDAPNLAAAEAYLAARADETARAGELLRKADASPELMLGSLNFAACAAMRLGSVDLAIRFFRRPVLRDIGPIIMRLEPKLHPLLDYEPFVPRRSKLTLVWPLEAPMLSPAVFRVFNEVRIESALPTGSDLGL